MIHDLVTGWENPALRGAMEPAPVTDAAAVVADLWDTLAHVETQYAFTRCCGLAAPQIGVRRRVSVVRFGERRHELVNPSIVESSGSTRRFRDACMSFFRYRGHPARASEITIEATDGAGRAYELHAEGELATLLQHEIDHLDGVLYPDRVPGGFGALAHRPEMPELR